MTNLHLALSAPSALGAPSTQPCFSSTGKPEEAQSCAPDGRAALEGRLSAEDGALLFSASSANGCAFQLWVAQDFPWLCKEEKKAKAFIPCRSALPGCPAESGGGSPFRYSPSSAAAQGRHWSSRRKCLGFACPPHPPLFLRGTAGFMQGKSKFALSGGDVTSPKQRALCFTVTGVQVLRTQLALQPPSCTTALDSPLHDSVRFALTMPLSDKKCYFSPESLRAGDLAKHSDGGKTEPNFGKIQNSVLLTHSASSQN